MAEKFAKIDDRQWRLFLGRLGDNIKDKAKLLTVAAKTHGFADIMRHFKNESGPDGGWQNLAPSTIAARKKGGGGAKILQDTGRLRSSIAAKSTRRRGRDSVEMFSSVRYSGKHDRGIDVPRREFMWLSERAQELMAQTVIEFSLKGT